MKQFQQIISMLTVFLIFSGLINGQEFQPEDIGRGTVAVVLQDGGVYIGWRLLASDPDDITFNVYRGTSKINTEPIDSSTNFVDTEGTGSDVYSIVPVIDDVEQEASEEISPWSNNYKTIPLDRPAGGQTPDDVEYTYSPNDISAGDLDGDGEYELVLKWDPSNSKDNSYEGFTGDVYLDGLEMDGTLLWRIDLGINVRAGAHYDPFMVYDLNGDGKAEVVCRTAPGSKDGSGQYLSDGPAASADHEADYRNSSGYIITGPEYLTVFNGADGTEMVTTDLEPARGTVSSWGDSWGNRVDRFLAAVLYLGSENPSFIWARGIYEKIEIAAWDLVNGELVQRWHFKSTDGYSTWEGMGSHNLSIADVDGDDKDEIIYGNCAIDDDGTGLWTLRGDIGKQTGDAMHLADILPDRPGLEKWGCGEGDGPGSHLVDAATGEVLWLTADADVGRATSGDLVEDYYGMECWGGTVGLRSAKNEYVGPAPSSTNHVVWWDGDLGRELLDATNIRKYGNDEILLLADGCASNNGSKANPCLQADLYGDWREEVIWRTSDNENLRIYTTTDVTSYRIETLMHDPVYRLGVAWQNDSYNQPPHTSYFLGFGMFTPDSLRPPARPLNVQAEAWDDTVQVSWDENTDSDQAGYRVYRGRSVDSLMLLSDVGTEVSYLDTDVTNDTTYYYAVTAYDTDGNESKYSDAVHATPSIRPDTPTGISYRFDTNSIILIWDSQDYENISSINIYRADTDSMEFNLIETVDKSSITFIDAQLTSGTTYYYKVTVTDTNDIESFPTEIQSITPGSSFTFQSEDAILTSVYVENNHLGYNGTGFTNFDPSNSSVEFTYMPGFGGGDRTLIFRYALGTDGRTGRLIVNDSTRSLTMAGTTEWTNYTYDSVGVRLNAGFDNTIRFATTGNDFGNLDEITIIPEALTGIESEDDESTIPTEFQLYQNYPNPFNPTTTISFGLPEAADVTIKIYDINGRLVSKLVNKKYQAGAHKLTFSGTHLASGVYFVHSIMQASGKKSIFTKKLILLK